MTSSAASRTEPFISRVRIENYKSIGHCDVELGPLAVLLGLNAAGKSNFLDAVRFVRDAVSGGVSRSVRARGGLDEVLRRVPAPTDRASITVVCRIPSPTPGDVPWQARYEITIARPELGQRHRGDVHLQREECEIGPADGSPHARFLVTDMRVEDSTRESPGRLTGSGPYLGIVGRTEPYALLHDALASMFFYRPDLSALRDGCPATSSDQLGQDGGHLGAVLGQLGAWERDRLTAYAAAIVPHLASVGPTVLAGNYVAAQMTAATGPGGAKQHFRAGSMSEGSLRAIGLLTALFQSSARHGRLPLVAVEQPERALHPMAAGVLFDALNEASTWTQILATSQSAELFDRKEADLSAVLIAAADNGVTTIRPVSPASSTHPNRMGRAV